jgi:Putative Actinobacterial Holin-X, holin superfamily III
MLQQQYNKAEELVIQLKAYVNTEIALVKLTVAEKLSKAFSGLIALLFVGAFFFFFILFASLALAYVIGAWLDKIWAGFLVVALMYLLIGVIAWYAREKLFRVPLMNAIIRQLFNNDLKKKI